MHIYLSSLRFGSESSRLTSLMRTPNAPVIANALHDFSAGVCVAG